jgi:hypothetical protein
MPASANSASGSAWTPAAVVTVSGARDSPNFSISCPAPADVA